MIKYYAECVISRKTDSLCHVGRPELIFFVKCNMSSSQIVSMFRFL